MTRLIITLLLLGTLIGVSIWEEGFASGIYKKLSTDIDTLATTMSVQTDIKTPENIADINKIYTYWTKKEKNLALIARQFDLAQIGDALVYIKNFVEFGNKEEAFAGIQRLRYLIDAQSHYFSTSLRNVI